MGNMREPVIVQTALNPHTDHARLAVYGVE